MTLINQFEQLLGKENVDFSLKSIQYYCNNVSGITRSIMGIVFPESTEQVQNIVILANEQKINLYPISSGKNWGLGSKLPVKDNSLIIDLKRMNKILEVNSKHGYAIIEPGVTQQQLYDYLIKNKLPYIFNVIGSGTQTSLIGNALDRGVGYFSSRAENLSGLEIVLGNGKIINTGFGHYPQSQTTHLYHHGVGPSIEGLFFQSNFGIVTKAGLDLIPKKELNAALVCQLNDLSKLELFIDKLAYLRKQEIIQTAFHIANKERARISGLPLFENYLKEKKQLSSDQIRIMANEIFEKEISSEWSAIGGVMGTKVHVKECYKQVKKEMAGIAKVIYINDERMKIICSILKSLTFIPWCNRKYIILKSMESAYELSKGKPTDSGLTSVYWPQNEYPKDVLNPDQSNSGLLYTLPVIPMDGESVRFTTTTAETIFQKYGFTPFITYNIINSKSLESVINLSFNKTDSNQLNRAHQCIDEVNKIYMKKGFILYRVGINQMHHITDENDTFWQLTSSLKKALDPNSIISDGRYNLIKSV